MSDYCGLKGFLSIPTAIHGSIDISKNTTATPEDIRKGKTAAVNGEVVEGALEEINWEDEKVKITPIGGYTIFKNTIYDKDTEITVDMSVVERTLKAENIKAGVTVKYTTESVTQGVDAFTGTFTADATAIDNKVLEGYTYYANGEKHTGTLKPAEVGVGIFDCLPFGSSVSTHGLSVSVYPTYGNTGVPYLRLYKGAGGATSNYTLVKVEDDDGYTINNRNVADEDKITSFMVTDSSDAVKPTSLDQALISVRGFYKT